MLFSDFLYHLSQAYEQFNLTEDAKVGHAYMCFVLDGNDTHEGGIVNKHFTNATGLDMLDIQLVHHVAALVSEIYAMEEKHGDRTWFAAIRLEKFGTTANLEGDKDRSSIYMKFSRAYSNKLRQEWLMELHEKYKALGQ